MIEWGHMDVSLYNIGFKGAARYPAKYMGESSFYDYVIFPLYYEKIIVITFCTSS